MANRGLAEVVRRLRLAALVGGGGLSDGQLLGRYLSHGEQEAFTALVKRHGPMVLSVCRRLLRDSNDADDAFQATFFVLIRKARTIVSRERVGHWLYGVAYRTALKAKAMSTRRRAKQKPLEDVPARAPHADSEWLALLDREINRLPEKYRLPIVLCDLEGKTRKQVAKQLGWPEGTVATRLQHGRSLVQRRLARHGLPAAAGVSALALPSIAKAVVPPALVTTTVQNATLYSAGAVAGQIPLKIIALAEGVLKAMIITKLKTVAGILVLVSVLGLGVGGITSGWRALAETQAPVVKKQSAPEAQPGNDPQRAKADVEKQFENAAGYSWLIGPDELRAPHDPLSISGMHFLGGSLTITELKDGSMVFVLAGAEPGLKGTDFHPVVFDKEGRRYLPGGWGGGSSPNMGSTLSTRYFHLAVGDLPAAKVAYVGIERKQSLKDSNAVKFKDYAEIHFGGGGGVSGTGIKDKPGFTIVPIEAPQGRTKLSVSFAMKEDQERTPSDFQVVAADADGRRYVPKAKSAVSAGGQGTTLITLVLDFSLSSDKIETLIVQERVRR